MDANQFKKMVYLLSAKLHRLTSTIIKNETAAEDIVQDAFVKLWRKRNELNNIQNIDGYVVTMVRNMCFDHLRKKKEELLDANDSSYINNAWEKAESYELNDQARLIEKTINQLPESQRVVIYMKDIQQYDNEEISKLLQMNTNAVRVNLSRARAKVKSEIIKLNNYANQSDQSITGKIL